MANSMSERAVPGLERAPPGLRATILCMSGSSVFKEGMMTIRAWDGSFHVREGLFQV